MDSEEGKFLKITLCHLDPSPFIYEYAIDLFNI